MENLVLADRRCNNDKRDLLPGPAHVTTWARRNQHHHTALAGLATAARWDTDPAATKAVARSIYSHLPSGATPLWLGYKHDGTADPATAVAALSQRRTGRQMPPAILAPVGTSGSHHRLTAA